MKERTNGGMETFFLQSGPKEQQNKCYTKNITQKDREIKGKKGKKVGNRKWEMGNGELRVKSMPCIGHGQSNRE